MRTSAAHDDSFLAAFSAGVLANPRHGDFSLMWSASGQLTIQPEAAITSRPLGCLGVARPPVPESLD
jgi:hypothetical protein